MLNRCEWCLSDPLYVKYHDREWGKVVKSDQKLFEFLVLEGAQAGLNWLSILKRRNGYKKAFCNYNLNNIIKYDKKVLDSILQNSDVIRNRLKIESVVNNAMHFLEIKKEFKSFSNYLWEFVDHRPIINNWKNVKDIPSESHESMALSKDLKKRGFKFVGPTIMYAYMQAMGLVNDHVQNCDFK